MSNSANAVKKAHFTHFNPRKVPHAKCLVQSPFYILLLQVKSPFFGHSGAALAGAHLATSFGDQAAQQCSSSHPNLFPNGVFSRLLIRFRSGMPNRTLDFVRRCYPSSLAPRSSHALGLRPKC